MIDTSRRLDEFKRGCDVTDQPDGKGGIVYGCLRVYGHEGVHYWGNHAANFKRGADGSFEFLGHGCAEVCEIHPRSK